MGLHEERAALTAKLEALVEKADNENRDLTEEEDREYQTLMAEANRLTEEIESARKREAKRAERAEQVRALAAAAATPASEPRFSGRSHKKTEKQEYSLLRAVRCLAAGHLDGFELEVSQEIARRSGRTPQGAFIPHDFADPLAERRAFDMTSGAGLGETVVSSNFIEILRNRTAVLQLGATVLDGLAGDLAIPKQSGASTAYWVNTESGGPTASAPTVGQVTLSPKTIGAMVDISRKLLNQQTASAEALVRNDIARVLGLGIDLAVLNGTGSGNNQPEGILQNSSVTTVAIGTNGGAITWDTVVGLETTVNVANANQGSLAYLTNAKVGGKLKTVPKVSGQAIFLADPGGTLNGYTLSVSNQMPSNLTKGTSSGVCSSMIFGDWSSVIIGLWSDIDLLVDPFTQGVSGAVRLRALQDLDIKLRDTAAFAKCVDITTS